MKTVQKKTKPKQRSSGRTTRPAQPAPSPKVDPKSKVDPRKKPNATANFKAGKDL